MSTISHMSFENIFFEPVVWLFITLKESFCRAEVYNFNEVQITNIYFINYAFDVLSKKSSPNQKSFRFPPLLSSRNFTALCFTFRCMTHFELISVFRFIVFHCGYSVLLVPFAGKNYLFTIVLTVFLYQRLYLCGTILSSLFCPIDFFFCPFPNATLS